MAELTLYIYVTDGRTAKRTAAALGAEVVLGPYVMEDGLIGHVELAVDGARRMMSDAYPDYGVEAPDPARGNAVPLQLSVPDLDVLAERLVAAGVTFDRRPEDEPGVGRVAVFHDPFGHRWFLNQPRVTFVPRRAART